MRRLLLFAVLGASLAGAAFWHASRFGGAGFFVPSNSAPAEAECGAPDDVLLALGGGRPLVLVRTPSRSERATKLDRAASPTGRGGADAATGGAERETRVIVRRGESLSGIVRAHYGTARPAVVDQVARANGIRDVDRVKEGLVLYLPPLSIEKND